jgi:peptide/nickel transport system permease protein
LRRGTARFGIVVVLLVVTCAILAPILAPYPGDAGNAAHLTQRQLSPRPGFWLGTDALGRDVLSRLLFGARVSLVIGAGAVALSAVTGTLLGMIAGYFGKWVDEAIMRFADVFLGIPPLVLAVLVVLTLGGGAEMSILAIAATNWPRYARLMRSEVLRVKTMEFVIAAQSYGAQTRRILPRHNFPAIQPTLLAQASLQFGAAILVAATLGFIGLGARPPSPEWGLSIAIGREHLPESWWISFFPGLTIALTVIAFNFLGDALRVALDARAQSSMKNE